VNCPIGEGLAASDPDTLVKPFLASRPSAEWAIAVAKYQVAISSHWLLRDDIGRGPR
jgi:hypothetical protein